MFQYYIFSMSDALIQALWALSTSTSYHKELTESVVERTESSMVTFVPSCRSIASCVRSFGARGDVLSIVEGEVIIAMSSAPAMFAER